jgi:hypothetical protein
MPKAPAARPTQQQPPASRPTAATPLQERCVQCAAPLAPDQRYCLNCGVPRTHLAGASSAAAFGAGGSASAPPIPGRTGGQSGPSVVLVPILLGVLALLVAMGVGVLIGDSIHPAAKTPAPVVIPVQASSGAGGATAAPSTSTPSTAAPSTSKPSAAGHAAKESSSAPAGAIKNAIPKGTGESPTKPAPLTAIENAKKKSGSKSGKNAEQQSNELPNSIETG